MDIFYNNINILLQYTGGGRGTGIEPSPKQSASRRYIPASRLWDESPVQGDVLGTAYRSVKATSNELNTGLNIYRIIDFEPVWIWACKTIPGAIG
jgi:hypothetical protein